MGNRKLYVKAEYLPTKLVDRLKECIFDNTRYHKPSKDNFLQCVSAIYYHQIRSGIGFRNYIPLGSKYWKTIYGGNYHASVINPLLEKYNIIESYDYGYRTFPKTNANQQKGKQVGQVGVRYRINPDLLNDRFEFISYINMNRARSSEEFILTGGKGFIIPDIPDPNYRVSINKMKACDWVDCNAERIFSELLKPEYINSLPDSLTILYHELFEKSENWTYKTRYCSVKTAKVIANTWGKEFFYFNNAFYIADIKEFRNQRIELLKYHYKQQIQRLGLGDVEERQNSKTLRLYSDLTNFPSRILQFININNSTVVQLDLRTSQFLLFANLLNTYIKFGENGLLKPFKEERTTTYLKKLIEILKKYQAQLPKAGVDIKDSSSGQFSNSDVTMFIRDVFFKDFYEVIQHELGFGDRMLAKHTLFKLLFKKSNRPDKLLSMLSQRYEVVMKIIAEFKEQDGNKKNSSKVKPGDDDHESNFSVFLSCVEGEIFVNNILNRLRDEGITCFTRHDSIVVESGYEDRSEAVAKQVFKEFGFRYNHRIDDKFWEVADPDELEFCDYMQWLIDENELEQNFYFDESRENSNEYESENIYDMDEQHLETIERLMEIGIRDEYYGLVDAVLLEEKFRASGP